MANRFNLLTALATTCLATAFPPPAVAYVRVPPQTLGSMCRMSTHIYVLSIEKFSVEKGVILFKPVEQLKGPGGLPESVLAKHLIGTNIKGSKVILDWAAEGKTAVLFAIMDYQGTKLDDGGGIGHVCIDGFWYWVGYKPNDKVWVAINSEPSSLSLYCGKADKLAGTVTKILHGEEVGVPAIVGDKRQLEEGRGIVQQVRAGLHLDPSSTFMGNVKAVSGDGKSFTLQPVQSDTKKQLAPIEIKIGNKTRASRQRTSEVGSRPDCGRLAGPGRGRHHHPDRQAARVIVHESTRAGQKERKT